MRIRRLREERNAMRAAMSMKEVAADVGRELGVSRQRVHVLLEEGRIGPAVHTRLGWLVEPGAVARAAEKRRAAAASRG